METRILGRTGRPVSVIGLGTWQLGADWGEVDPADARAVLSASVDRGRHPLRHRGRLRRRPERVVHRRFPRRALRARHHSGDQDGAPDAADARRTPRRRTSERGRTDRAATSGSRRWISCSCTARRLRSSRDAATYDALDALVQDGAITTYGVVGRRARRRSPRSRGRT